VGGRPLNQEKHFVIRLITVRAMSPVVGFQVPASPLAWQRRRSHDRSQPLRIPQEHRAYWATAQARPAPPGSR
jgi:hypothetical protein